MKTLNWKTLNSKYVIKDNWISLRSDTYQMPSGVILDPFYVLEYPNWVHVAAFNENNDILIVEQYRPGIKQACFELPCGGIEKDENPKDAAVRELEEETGYSFSSVHEIGKFCPNPHTHTNYVYAYLADGHYQEGPTRQEESEEILNRFMSLKEVEENIKSGKFVNSHSIAALYLALRFKNYETLIK